MILFFDTNIFLDVALRREPHFERSHAVLTEGIGNHSCFMSWHTVSNLAYILEKFEGVKNALEFIENTAGVCRIAPVQHEDLLTAFQYNQGDFEDAMQIAAALACHAEMIVTRDETGFSRSPIPVASSLH